MSKPLFRLQLNHFFYHCYHQDVRLGGVKSTVMTRFKSIGSLLPTWSTAKAKSEYVFPEVRGRKAMSSVIPQSRGSSECS